MNLSFVSIVVGLFGLCIATTLVCPNAPCRDYNNKWIVTRYWALTGNYTTADVVASFGRDFAPNATQLDGFNEYLASIPSNTNNFFFNVFDTSDQADIVQTNAQQFVNLGALNGQITRVAFGKGQYKFFFLNNSTVCSHDSDQFFYLSTRLWSLVNNSDALGVIQEFQKNFAPVISAQPGFREYAGILLTVNGTDLPFFYNVFDTKIQALNANNLAAQFVQNGVLNNQIVRNTFTSGPIMFDFRPTTTVNVNSTSS